MKRLLCILLALLAERFGALVVFPDYRLAWQSPYPATLEDCYAALEWMYAQADELGIDRSRIVVGADCRSHCNPVSP